MLKELKEKLIFRKWLGYSGLCEYVQIKYEFLAIIVP